MNSAFANTLLRIPDSTNKIRTSFVKFRVRSMNLKTAGYPRFRLFTPVPLVFFNVRSIVKLKQAVPLANLLAD